ncbi:hypothetical protein [Kitasatospora sp. HPMI-4]|uniref:hypothetical protein n=1 Tax=Kitasatospora sp. HPMI-4 TaxID=3448443 RepID=UPI003F1CEEE6
MSVLVLFIPPALLGAVLLLGRLEDRLTAPPPDRQETSPAEEEPQVREAISEPADPGESQT